MSDDAIDPREDVSAEEQAAADQEQQRQEPEQPEREPTERERRMAEIAREYNEANGIQVEEEEQPEGEEHEAGEQEDPDDPDSQQQPAARDPLEELGYYRNDAGDLVTTMKINGEEREVKAEQVKAYLQKDLAGDYKLQQAAERERRLQEAENLLKQREGQIQQSLSQRPSEMDADEAKKQAKAVLERVWDGDDEAAAEALAEFMQRGNTTADADQIRAMAEQSALTVMEQREQERQQAEFQNQVDEGNRELKQQHPEIYQDDRLFDLVNSETARIMQRQEAGDPEYTDLTPKDIIARAADEVQGWMDGRKEQPKQTDGTREERKRDLKPMPKGLTATRQPKPKQEVDTSPAAVIARMRQSRAVTS